MNTQKDLDQNELAIWMSKVNQSIEPYSKLIAVVAFVLIVGALAWGLYNSQLSGERSDATLQLLMEDPDVAEKFPETAAAAWSKLYSANQDLESGIQALYADRSDAETLLTQAKESYNDALSSSEDQLLRSRAYLGLALASESMGELDAAIESYQKCIDTNESAAMVTKAQTRIDELNSPETKDFVAWFAKQDFRPADPSLPPELPTGESLPDLPDLNLGPLLSGGEKEGEDAMSLEDTPGEIELPEGGASKEMPATESKEGSKLDLPSVESAEAAVKEAATEVTEKATEGAKEVAKDAKDAVKDVVEKAVDTAKEATGKE